MFIEPTRGADSDPLAIAVVGAGACVLPSWLASLSPRCRVAAVECSSEVIEAARRCFGLNDAPPARLQVLIDEGVSFVNQCARGSYDAMLVTAGGLPVLNGACSGEQLAPPASMTGKDFAAAVLRALRPGGLYAVNILCRTEEGSAELLEQIRDRLVDTGFDPGSVHVATSGARPQRNFLLFATAPAASAAVAKELCATELLARYGEMVGSPAEKTDDGRTLLASVRWQCFEQWKRENHGSFTTSGLNESVH